MLGLYKLVDTILWLYSMVLIVSAVLSWLTAFGVVNRYSPAVRTIGDFCYRLTEPLLRPIRRFIPDINGIDLSPLVLYLIIMFIRWELEEIVLPMIYR